MHDRFSYTKKEADMLGLKEEDDEGEDEEEVLGLFFLFLSVVYCI